MTSASPARSAAWGAVARTFHWGVALLLLVQIPLAWYMVEQPLGPAKLGNYALHKSVGMVIFTVTALRLAWRTLHPAPPLPPGTPGWQRGAARLTQGLLYFFMFAMPLTGWLNSSAANFPVSVFGLFTLPNLVDPDPVRQVGFENSHRVQSYALFAVLTAHLAGALYHHYVKRDGVLTGMLAFRRAPR
jgi:cytochrome b561